MGVNRVDTFVGKKLARYLKNTLVFTGKQTQLRRTMLDDGLVHRLELTTVFHRRVSVCRLATSYLVYLLSY